MTLTVVLLAAIPPVEAQCDRIPDCVLVWSDEFDGDGVDPSKWSFMYGDGTDVGLPPGWGNNELQYYRAENATVADGTLTITAREEPFGGREYTSARLRSLGKGDWTFGRIEMRAKMPIGRGLWPAFWMLASNTIYGTWAASGEIDVVEYVGSEPDRIFGTIHYGGPFPGNRFSSSFYALDDGTFHDEFHDFAIEWEYGEIRWYVDDVQYGTKNFWYSTGGAYPAPFDVDFHLLLNLAVGGNLPGSPDASTPFPQEYVIDWVRVYQEPRSITLTGPSADDLFAPGDDLTMTATVDDEGATELVEFLQGNAVLGEDASPPYELTVPGVAAGCYSLAARATDVDGRRERSIPVDVAVGDGCPQAPYRMRPTVVPGPIEAEDYDLGGQGVAYNDANAANNGVAYRPGEGVDVERTSDVGGGFNVGWMEPGEWIEYTIVGAPGTYDVELRVASAVNGGTLHLEVDGADATGPIAFDGTGGWQIWRTVGALDVQLGAGVHTLRLVVDDGAYNVNRIDVVAPPDADLDGVPDRADDCVLSETAPTVVIDGCDSGTRNVVGDDGCTLSDRIAEAAAAAGTHGGFVAAVAHLMKTARRDRLIGPAAAAAVVRCAARSGIPGVGSDGHGRLDLPRAPGVRVRGRHERVGRPVGSGTTEVGRREGDDRPGVSE